MKNKILYLILLTLLITGCSKNNQRAEVSLSFITTFSSENSSILHSEIGHMNLEDEKITFIDEINYNSQYPLAVYDSTSDLIFYTNRNEGSNMDHIYMKDLNNGTSQQITSNLYATNYIFPFKQGMYTISIEAGGNPIINLYELHVSNNYLPKKINFEKDFTITGANYNPVSEEIYVVGYSFLEQKEKMETQNFDPIETRIYRYKNNTIEMIYKTYSSVITPIKSICSNEKFIIYSTGFSFYVLDLDTLDLRELYFDDSGIISQLVYLSTSDDLYYIVNNSKDSKLCKYNLVDKKIKELFKVKYNEQIINNACIIDN